MWKHWKIQLFVYISSVTWFSLVKSLWCGVQSVGLRPWRSGLFESLSIHESSLVDIGPHNIFISLIYVTEWLRWSDGGGRMHAALSFLEEKWDKNKILTSFNQCIISSMLYNSNTITEQVIEIAITVFHALHLRTCPVLFWPLQICCFHARHTHTVMDKSAKINPLLWLSLIPSPIQKSGRYLNQACMQRGVLAEVCLISICIPSGHSSQFAEMGNRGSYFASSIKLIAEGGRKPVVNYAFPWSGFQPTMLRDSLI